MSEQEPSEAKEVIEQDQQVDTKTNSNNTANSQDESTELKAEDSTVDESDNTQADYNDKQEYDEDHNDSSEQTQEMSDEDNEQEDRKDRKDNKRSKKGKDKNWKEDRISSAKEFFNTEILYRFDIIPPEETAPLKGKYKLDLAEQGKWILDIDTQLDVIKAEADSEAEITLEISNDDFLELINGELNPQLALLSKKIKVTGDINKAIKVQDILCPK